MRLLMRKGYACAQLFKDINRGDGEAQSILFASPGLCDSVIKATVNKSPDLVML